MKRELLVEEESFKAQLRTSFESFGLYPIDRMPPPPAPAISARRGFIRPPTDAVEVLSLIRDPAGVLRWDAGAGLSSAVVTSRRAGRAALPPGHVVQQFAYERIAPNEALRPLNALDDR